MDLGCMLGYLVFLCEDYYLIYKNKYMIKVIFVFKFRVIIELIIFVFFNFNIWED